MVGLSIHDLPETATGRANEDIVCENIRFSALVRSTRVRPRLLVQALFPIIYDSVRRRPSASAQKPGKVDITQEKSEKENVLTFS